MCVHAHVSKGVMASHVLRATYMYCVLHTYTHAMSSVENIIQSNET